MSEVDIHCNAIRCRKPLSLEKQACVTSCSHIFCVDCSNHVFSKALVCPACSASLGQNDDIILTDMNPSEDYKSSVLAGLKPEVILDICSRAIAFYEYQTSQELLYKSIMQKNVEDKYHALKDKFQMITRDLNHVIKNEKDKNTALLKDFEQEKAKYQQALNRLDEKSKQFQRLQTIYEKLKRKTNTSNMQENFLSPPPATTPYRTNNLVAINPQQQQVPQQQQQQQTIILDESDVISRIGRASTVAGSRSIYHHQQGRPSRIPSPIKTATSHSRKYHHSPSRTDQRRGSHSKYH